MFLLVMYCKMANNDLLWFVASMIVMNIGVIAYLVYIFKYHIRGLNFLIHAEKIISKNDEPEQLEIISNNDIPLYTETMYATKGMIYFVFATFNVNIILFLLSLLHGIETTTLWMILSWVMIGSNAFILISLNSFSKLKISINATCEAYNVLIQSYEYMKEYEDNNDNTNGL